MKQTIHQKNKSTDRVTIRYRRQILSTHMVNQNCPKRQVDNVICKYWEELKKKNSGRNEGRTVYSIKKTFQEKKPSHRLPNTRMVGQCESSDKLRQGKTP